MNANLVNQYVFLSCMIACLLASSCHKSQEPSSHNDPSKYRLSEDVLWASPDDFDLTMDIYTPDSKKETYPVIVMFHGGGWLINDKSIMEQAAAYIATNANYVVCNVNYRLLSDKENSIQLHEIVNDAFGAVLWVKDNISLYAGDSSRIAVTGDSAGAHLSAMIINMGNQLSSEPFSLSSPRFKPSYLPPGRTAEEIAKQNGLEVQAGVLSYGAFDVYQAAIAGFETLKNPFWVASGSLGRGVFGDDFNVVDHPNIYRAVSPIHNIPNAADRLLPPQLLTVGSEDSLVTPASVKSYRELLQSAGHTARYWEYQGKSHAFLDSGSNVFLGSDFETDAPEALNVMIEFLDEIFTPDQSAT